MDSRPVPLLEEPHPLRRTGLFAIPAKAPLAPECLAPWRRVERRRRVSETHGESLLTGRPLRGAQVLLVEGSDPCPSGTVRARVYPDSWGGIQASTLAIKVSTCHPVVVWKGARKLFKNVLKIPLTD